MANWTKKSPAGSTRRKWNLEDRASLNNLKFHFAADGCSDVQYDLARQLLDSNSELDENTSHAQGIHWLLCAAHQGHEEALEMLRECYKNRRGITDSNELDVKTCLSMTSGERAARKAARELFACLSNGEEHITPSQLEKRMREIYKLQKRKKPHNNNSSSSEEDEEDDCDDGNGDIDDRCNSNGVENNLKTNGHIYPSPNHIRGRLNISQNNLITEANLVTAAVNYSHGRLPAVNDVLTLSIPHPNTLDHVPCFHRLIFHPIIFFTLLYHRFIKIISSLPGRTNSNMKLLLLLLFYSLISSFDNLVIFLPIIIYYTSLILMIWSTFKMLKTKHDFIDFRIWSGLFLSYGDNNLNAGQSENQFLRNNMKPYLYFFGSFIVNLTCYPIITNEWIPNSEITLIAFFLVFITMIAFMYTSSKQFPDILILLSFGINVLAKYPYESDDVVTTGWRFLDLKVPTFCSFVIGNGIEFCLNCRAILYLLIPGFLIHLARRSNWHGTYIYLIPHCVTLSWLQICITCSQSVTMFGLVRATLGLSGILLFLPLFGIITLMIPIFLTVEWLGLTEPKVRMATSLTAAIIALFGSCLMAINRTTQKYVTILQVTICIIAAAVLTLPYMTSNFGTTTHSESSLYNNIIKPITMIPDEEITLRNKLTWESYDKYCGQQAWEHHNKIQTQIRCSQLEGIEIKWEGIISNIEITKVYNYRKDLIKNYLPKWLSNLVTCFYGDKNHIQCSENENCNDIKIVFDETNNCNLNKWNIYEYEIKIRIHSGILSKPGEVYLKTSNYFSNFTKNLYQSDRIWFRGKFLNHYKQMNGETIDMTLGIGRPIIEIFEIGCITCHNKDLISIKANDLINFTINARMKDLMRGIKYLLNVLFNPLLTFK